MILEYMDWRNRKMRDILFRGKREDNGKWVRDSETYIRDGDGIWLNDFSEEAGNEVVRVERETLGQYTGFRDEYGKEIYEGDIIHYLDGQCPDKEENWNCLGAVIWDDEVACFYVVGVRSALTFEILSDCVVVGNIYDNPELWERWKEEAL